MGATYLKDDTVKDVNNVFGGGIDSLLVCITYHENASAADVAFWDVWIDTGQLDQAVDDAEDARDAALGYSEDSQGSYWNSEASRRTSDNYAVTPEDTFVNVVSSDGDGTYTNTPTTNYSSLHWAAKSDAGVVTVEDNLTTDSGTDALSARQGKKLQDEKQANITGGASTITSSNLTASRALVSNSSGKVAVSAVTSTELSRLDGVTSSVQTQLNGKLSTTGTAADSTKLGGVAASSYLRTTGKAADSNKLDNLDSTQFLRSDTSDTMTGTLTVNGTITCTGNVTAYSDERLKTNIKVIIDAVDKVKKLKGITYVRKADDEVGTGLIAQDVQKVLPEAVMDDGSYLSVAYGNITGLLVEAIKELSDRVSYLEQKSL